MMHFDLRINGEVITKVSVINKGPMASTDERDDWRVYEWNAWRPDPEVEGRMHRYAAGELVHGRDDGIEQLAIQVLTEYRRVLLDHDIPMTRRTTHSDDLW